MASTRATLGKRKKRSGERALRAPPTFSPGDPTVEYTSAFTKLLRPWGSGLKCHIEGFDGIVTIGPKRPSETNGLASRLPKGDNGIVHRYLIDDVLVESDDVWFGGGSNEKAGLRGIEIAVKAEDDAKVHFLSTKTGKFVNRETFEDEKEEFECEQILEEDLYNEVKHWHKDSCHSSIVAFRKRYAERYMVRGVCRCGVAVEERRVKKKDSSIFGQTFFGCPFYPNGCSYFSREG